MAGREPRVAQQRVVGGLSTRGACCAAGFAGNTISSDNLARRPEPLLRNDRWIDPVLNWSIKPEIALGIASKNLTGQELSVH